MQSSTVRVPASAASSALHLVLLQRVEAAGRLVDDQQRRIVQERLRQRDALLVALREVADHAPLDVARARSARARARPRRAARAPREPARAAGEAQEALDAQLG